MYKYESNVMDYIISVLIMCTLLIMHESKQVIKLILYIVGYSNSMEHCMSFHIAHVYNDTDTSIIIILDLRRMLIALVLMTTSLFTIFISMCM